MFCTKRMVITFGVDSRFQPQIAQSRIMKRIGPGEGGKEESTMPEKELIQYWLPAITALWGGTVGYLRQVQKGRAFKIAAMVLHLSISGFSGLMFWLVSVEYGLSGPMSAIVTGMAGYMGGEAIKLLEDRVVGVASK